MQSPSFATINDAVFLWKVNQTSALSARQNYLFLGFSTAIDMVSPTFAKINNAVFLWKVEQTGALTARQNYVYYCFWPHSTCCLQFLSQWMMPWIWTAILEIKRSAKTVVWDSSVELWGTVHGDLNTGFDASPWVLDL